jgi:hypothetical protein
MAVRDRNISLEDGGSDDLPRTLRREREARERANLPPTAVPQAPATPVPREPDWSHSSWPQPAVVTAIKVPFFRLMLFMIKAVLAALPALILLTAILWGFGWLLKMYFPWLVHFDVHIIPRR